MRRCNVCHIVKPIELFSKNASRPLGRSYDCKACMSKRKSAWYKINFERIREKNHKYKKDNKKKVAEAHNLYARQRYNTDPIFNFRVKIRNMIGKTFKKKGFSKNNKIEEILGCTIPFFFDYLEKQFTPEMTWENKGSYWHIDHIYPISMAKTQEDTVRLNHYTNLRPLEAKENLRKSNKLPNDL